jgi:hypothetical protein
VADALLFFSLKITLCRASTRHLVILTFLG